MATFQKSTMVSYLPEVWSALATVTYRSNTVLAPLFDRRWEPELGVGQGDTVNIPNFSQNDASIVQTRGTFGTAAGLTWTGTQEGQTKLEVDTLITTGFRIPVEMSVQHQPGYLTNLTEGIGQALALKLDSNLASDGADGLAAFTSIGTDNVDVTESVIFQGETNLNDNNAPVEGRNFVMSPATRASLMQIEAIRNQLYSNTIGNLPGDRGAGYMGNILTLACYMSNNLASGTSGKKNAIFQTEAIALVVQQNVKIVHDLNIEDGLMNQYVGYLVYGAKMVKSAFGREVDGK